MMSHDLARKLLALPNLPMSGYYEGGEPEVQEEIDPDHPDFRPFDGDRGPDDPRWAAYRDRQPRRKVIGD